MCVPTSIEQTNHLLRKVPITGGEASLVLLTGSSGCGKTYLCEGLRARIDTSRGLIQHFDTIGVPPVEQMIAEFGSCEAWQKAKTEEWIGRLTEIRDKPLVIFEGQYNPHFAIEALNKYKVKDWTIAVVTCTEDIWVRRLRGPREQGFLVTDDMRNWARVLREETLKAGGSLIDTSASNLEANLSDVAKLINPLLEKRITQQ